MTAFAKNGWARRLLLTAAAALVLLAGCAGLQPFEPRNHREEGPAQGVFTGAAGAIVIPVPVAAPSQPDGPPPESPDAPRQTE
jgi:negative regulator of sigma E activity